MEPTPESQKSRPDYTLPPEVGRMLTGFAGPFATWILHGPARVLFDCGEGISSVLQNHVFLPESIFLTHSHMDHIGGLAGFLMSRATMRGDHRKPLRVYFPDGAQPGFQALWQYLDVLLPKEKPRPEWLPLRSGDRVAARSWTLDAFATHHGVPSLGYRILEQRKRLKAEFSSLPPDEIRRRRLEGTEVSEDHTHVVFAISGDTGPGLDPALFHNADLLLHESTFLRAEDREGMCHATTADAFELAVRAQVKHLVLYHFSQRHSAEEIRKAIDLEAQRTAFPGRVSCIAGHVENPVWYGP